MAHDIAMLKLRKPAKINRAVGMACLPGSSGRVPDGKRCWVTGTAETFQTANPYKAGSKLSPDDGHLPLNGYYPFPRGQPFNRDLTV